MDLEENGLEQQIDLARMLVARLERLSADSYWAHQASGVRGSLLRGAGLVDLAVPLTALAVIGSTIFVLSALRFRKTLG